MVLIFILSGCRREALEGKHFQNSETKVVVSNLAKASLRLFKAGANLPEALPVAEFDGTEIWLPPGDYFLEAGRNSKQWYYPISLIGYKAGAGQDGNFEITVRDYPSEEPRGHRMMFVPSGYFLMGDRLNPEEPHYIWTGAFFISAFEITNSEFREFLHAGDGYSEDSNWTADGKKWRQTHQSSSTAMLQEQDPQWQRFGKGDYPVVQVKWFEANAYCKWLTKKLDSSKWLASLPSEAEWEKAARGPDHFDYGLGRRISDPELQKYNWSKNPTTPVTVIGIEESLGVFERNRYGLYHASGNVSEWTQSISEPFSRRQPYIEEDRNRHNDKGQRVVRGGSWYTATTALLYLAYRDSFQPEHSSDERGFRIVVKRLPH